MVHSRRITPSDKLDRAFSDDGYATLRTFFDQVASHLGLDGRVLMFFGTTGGIEYFHELAVHGGKSPGSIRHWQPVRAM